MFVSEVSASVKRGSLQNDSWHLSCIVDYVWGINTDELWPEAYELRTFAQDAEKQEHCEGSRKESLYDPSWGQQNGG